MNAANARGHAPRPTGARIPLAKKNWRQVLVRAAVDTPHSRCMHHSKLNVLLLQCTGLTFRFRAYAHIVEERLMPRFNATWHWAKLEVPQSEAERKKLQARISKRYPVDK
eukprot:scaffold4496_cov18-Tisochrysis_lutea.AAC.1